MPLATATVSGVSIQVGTSLPRPGVVTATLADPYISDDAANAIHSGIDAVTVDADGTFSLTLPAGYVYTFRFTPDDDAPGWTIGPALVSADAGLDDIEVVQLTPPVNLDYLTQVLDARTEAVTAAASVQRGIAGGVASLDSAGVVIEAPNTYKVAPARTLIDRFAYLRAQLGKRTTKRIIFAFIGDSISEGVWAPTPVYKTRWQAFVADMLRQAYPVAGAAGSAGYMPAYYADALLVDDTTRTGPSGDFTETSWIWGPGGRSLLIAGDNNATLTWPAQMCDRIRIWYGKTNYLGGAFKVDIDGVDVTTTGTLSSGSFFSGTITCNDTAKTDGYYWESPALSTTATHTVKVTSTYSGGVAVINGAEFLRGDSSAGVQGLDCGHSGATMSLFANASNLWGHLVTLAAQGHVVVPVISLGTNDNGAYNTSPAAYEASARALQTTLESILGATHPRIWVHGYRHTDTANWQGYRAALETIAAEKGDYARTLDIASLWGPIAADGSVNWSRFSESTNPTHLTRSGSVYFADIMGRELSGDVVSRADTQAQIDTLAPYVAATYRATKTASTSITSNATQTVYDLKATVPVGVYQIEGLLFYSSNTTADLAVALSLPAGTTGAWGVRGLGPSATGNDGTVQNLADNTLAQTLNLGGVGAAVVSATIHGTLTVTTAGQVALTWAQKTSDAGTTVVYTGSRLTLTKIG